MSQNYLDSETLQGLASGWGAGFDRHRSVQGLPSADVLRYQSTGGDVATGEEPAVTDISVYETPCLRRQRTPMGLDVTEYSDEAGRLRQGVVCLGFDIEILETDKVRYPAGSGSVYEVEAAALDPAANEWWVLARGME